MPGCCVADADYDCQREDDERNDPEGSFWLPLYARLVLIRQECSDIAASRRKQTSPWPVWQPVLVGRNLIPSPIQYLDR